MATRSLGRLTLDLVADIGGFERSMSKAGRRTRSTMRDIEKHVNAAARVLAGLGVAAAGATTELVRRSANAAQELQNMADIANASTGEIQTLTFAGRDLGIEQQKVADILKDVNDRVGDFIQTGAGPMADFFENIAPQVGVTAEEFRNLSGPEALQLFISSLEDANLNQQDMTFYMEQIASDATALLPLFRENGRELDSYARKAEELGVILSETEIDNLVEVSRQMEEFGAVMEVTAARIAADASPAIEDLMDLLQDPDTLDALKSLADGVVSATSAVVEGVTEAVRFAEWAGEQIAVMRNGVSGEDLTRIEQQIDTIEAWLEGDMFAGGGRLRLFGKDGIVEYYDDQELQEMLRELKAARDNLTRDMETSGPVFPLFDADSATPDLLSGPTGGTGRSRSPSFDAGSAVPDMLQGHIDQQAELNTLADDYLASTRETISLMGEETELAELRYQLEHGRLAGLAPERKQQLEDAAAALDAARESARAEEQLLEKHRESMELASEYREMALTEEERALDDLKEGYAEIRDLVADGYLSPDQARAANEALRDDYAETIDAMKDKTDEMSAFGERAAQNMQDAFADFLFDPMEDGFEGMLEEFADVLKRMAAEAAAAQIFDSIGNWGQQNQDNTDWTGLVASFAGFFDAGGNIPAGGWGVAGENGPEVVRGPANVIGTDDTRRLMQGGQGVSIRNVTMSFPGVGNSREAEASAGAAGRRLLHTISGAQRYR